MSILTADVSKRRAWRRCGDASRGSVGGLRQHDRADPSRGNNGEKNVRPGKIMAQVARK